MHRVFVFLAVHNADADDAGDEVDRLHDQREENAFDAEDRIERRAENHGADVFRCGGFEDVRATAGAVAHVVAYQIGDHGRVARIVFRDSGFHFADQISAYVSSLGVDAAAKLGEERHQRGAETEADQLDTGSVAGDSVRQRRGRVCLLRAARVRPR